MENEKLDEQIKSLKELMINSLNHNIDSFKKADVNFEILSSKIDEVNAKVDELAKSANVQFGKVGGKLDGIQKEIEKIQKVSNYTGEYENLLRIAKP